MRLHMNDGPHWNILRRMPSGSGFSIGCAVRNHRAARYAPGRIPGPPPGRLPPDAPRRGRQARGLAEEDWRRVSSASRTRGGAFAAFAGLALPTDQGSTLPDEEKVA